MQKLNLGFLAELYSGDACENKSKQATIDRTNEFVKSWGIKPIVATKINSKEVNPITGKAVISRKLHVINLVIAGYTKKEVVTDTQKYFPDYKTSAILSVISNKKNFA